MAITTKNQALAQEIIEELNDKKPRVFGIYCALIKRHGEIKVRQVLSEVKHDYHAGKICNPSKVFMFRLKNNQ